MIGSVRFATVPYLCLAAAAIWSPSARGYSVLTHEAIVDSLWDPGPARIGFKRLILKKFPETSADRLIVAHGYAYGGCIIQDVGYYPFGSKLFSDLVHYVRSGDFVEALIANAQSPDEYAFALGALAHYAADNDGHPIAINKAVPMMYPKLRAQYGDTVTYADNPAAHVKVEFGFDVWQVAHGRYAPRAYHDFIGFETSKPLLEKAFEETYDLKLKDVFGALDLALGTYRRTVGNLIPEITKAAWADRKKDILKADPAITRKKFLYTLRRASYEKDWGRTYERPGVFARVLGFLLRIMPKAGPFRAFSFRVPTPEAELLFQKSFERAVDLTRENMRAIETGRLKLENRDFDTGKPAKAGEYSLADRAYAKLLEKLAERKFRDVQPELRANILGFYGAAFIGDPAIREELAELRASGSLPAGLKR